MLFAALAHLMLQSPASVPDAFRESPASAPAPAAETIASSEGATVPEWALTDPFGYERARCNPMVRGETPLDVCQSRVRSALAASLGDDLPDAAEVRDRLQAMAATQAVSIEEPGAATAVEPAAADTGDASSTSDAAPDVTA